MLRPPSRDGLTNFDEAILCHLYAHKKSDNTFCHFLRVKSGMWIGRVRTGTEAWEIRNSSPNEFCQARIRGLYAVASVSIESHSSLDQSSLEEACLGQWEYELRGIAIVRLPSGKEIDSQ